MVSVSCRGPRRRQRDRRGTVLVLTALLLIPLLAMAAFAIDWGLICVTKAELERAADAAAMAGAWELREANAPASQRTAAEAVADARQAAMEYAAMNTAFGKPMQLQPGDIEVGYLADPLKPGGQLDTSTPERFNAVRVRVRRDAGSNGAIPMFFARVLGKESVDAESSATATFIDNVAGFKKPLAEGGPYIPILPFALDVETWHAALDGAGPDEWKWDDSANKFVFGSDGIHEFNLYPQDTGSAANRGTVNIGTTANSTSHIARQILYGISQQDWEFHNGSLTFNEDGELFLNGSPGISAGVQNELHAIRGQGRVVPIFSHVEGDGDNAVYTIVEWAGVRIIEVDLTGDDKRLIVQAGEVTASGTVPNPSPKRKSKFVFSRVWISR